MKFPIGNVSSLAYTDSALPTKTSGQAFRYRADVDGLRAIAVLAVLCYHAGIGCTGGYVGVDVFFVISGYLITGLIRKDIELGQFQIRKFWERRVRRILPALAAVVLSSLAIGWFILLPTEFNILGKSIVAQALLASNVYFWLTSGYFAQGVGYQPLLHTWSLGVEEQFYLLFPGLLVVCHRVARRYLVPILLLLCGLSFALCTYWSYLHPDANFYLLPTRAWELGAGAVLALIPAQRAIHTWLAETLSWGGLLAILVAVFLYTGDTRFPGVTALLPVVGAVFVIWANDRALTSVGKLLALRPIVFVGLISYSLYLWHWPVLVFAKYWLGDPLSSNQRLCCLVISMVLAVVSWKFVETPFRIRAIFKSRTQIFALAGITTAVFVFTGLLIYRLQGVPSRIPAAAVQYANGSIDRPARYELRVQDVLAGDFVELGAGDTRQPIDVVVWGDSLAMAALPAFDFLCKQHAVRGVAVTHSSTCPLVGFASKGKYSLRHESIAFNNAVVAFIRRTRAGHVVLVGNWATYFTEGDMRRGFTDTIRALEDTGAKIWIMREVPLQQCSNPPVALATAVMQHRDPQALGVSLVEHRKAYSPHNRLFAELTATYPRVTVLDPTYLFVKSKTTCRMGSVKILSHFCSV